MMQTDCRLRDAKFSRMHPALNIHLYKVRLGHESLIRADNQMTERNFRLTRLIKFCLSIGLRKADFGITEKLWGVR